MRIETERMILYDISDDEIRALIDAESDDEMRQAYSEMLNGCIRDPENRIWYSVWLMELKEQGTIVGDFCFKGPAADGTVEIGYGLRSGFCGRGYMTECVRVITTWALAQTGVSRVEAETDAGNTASQNVLARCGFVITGETGGEGPRFACTDRSMMP